MAASDFAPTRLDAAKAIIGDFLATRRNETVGLVAFGGRGPRLPAHDGLCVDSGSAREPPARNLRRGNRDRSGIATAVAHAARSSAPEKQIILLTDGENNAGSMDPATAARTAARFGIALSIIGVGSPGEAPVTYVDPVTHEKLSGIYRSDFNGASLEALSRTGGGNYYGAENRAALALGLRGPRGASSSLSRSRSVSSEEGLTGQVVAAALALLALARLLGLAGGGGRP